ncbi:SDR family oxidoreductase [Planococcus maritimus]|uniref:SDR family oxidoreductase n=1 Tax=Planococcus maritimus TaxID=192421 RepID=UPI000793D389|nr:SDR family oxidoreductase [Planococcus maritimus]KYG58393.1 hypothetical protein AY633_08945 [Planococcus maritimus]OED31855.1 hypothetical protein BHE17_05160 [Planococcus maritimus]
MKILILGGTRFLGRFLTRAALDQGHEVTLFNRGKENPALFPEVEKLVGDRDGELAALEGRTWDAVIDTCGYVPQVVRQSAALLAGNAGHYTFISSASVYDDLQDPGIDEEHAVRKLPQDVADPPSNEYYGELKFLCEREVEKQFPDRALIIRPGLIVGPYDFTGRFSYWTNRVAQGGEVLAPGRKDRQIQFIDVRDLAEWILRMVEQQVSGVFNATGPSHSLTMEAFLKTCRNALASRAQFVWMDDEFLMANDVGYWMELPLWIPDSENVDGFMAMSIDKALAQGLSFRPLEETIQDTHEWLQQEGVVGTAGLDSSKELRLLASWKER